MYDWDFYSAMLPFRQKDDSIEVAEVAAEERLYGYGHCTPSWRGLSPYQSDHGSSDYRRLGDRHGADSATLWTAAIGGASRSWFWWHDGTAFRVGREHPEVDAALMTLEKGGVPVVPLPLAMIRDGYRRRNPWRLDREWKEMASLSGSGGLRCSFLLDEWRRRVRTESCDVTEPKLLVAGGGTAVRELLRKVVERPLALKPDEANLAFRLHELVRAPLVAFELRPGEPAHAVASLGAGKLLRIVACTFPGEAPQAGLWIDGAYDYGDFRLWPFLLADEALDGTPRAAVVRRRAGAEAAGLQHCGYVDDDGDGGASGSKAGWPSTTGNPSGGGRDNA